MLRTTALVLRRLFFAAPREDVGALARLGRVCHWTLAGIGVILMVFAIASTVALAIKAAQFNPFADDYPVTASSYVPAMMSLIAAAAFALFGRGLRYIFSNE